MECKRAANEFAKLAQTLKDQPKVARADCTFDREACDLLVNHLPSSNNSYPYIMMLTDSRAHVWTGALNATEIIEKFATGIRYMEYR